MFPATTLFSGLGVLNALECGSGNTRQSFSASCDSTNFTARLLFLLPATEPPRRVATSSFQVIYMDKTNLVPTANKVGAWTFHLGDSSRNPLFNSTSPVTNQDKLIQFELTNFDAPFIVILFRLALLFFHCSVQIRLQ